MNKKHNDCRNFITVDVAKGICSISNEKILIDSKVCTAFVNIKKCKNCGSFAPSTEKTLGTCTGFKEPDWAYGDLVAENCEKYSPKNAE